MITVGLGSAIAFAQSLTRSRRVRAAAQRGLERAGERLVDKVRAANTDDTGGLDESVRVGPGKNLPAIVVKAGGPSTTKGGYDYALAVEYGTRKRGAQPFFHPTIRENLDIVDDEVGSAVRDEMES